MLRLAHISDVHINCPRARWRPGDWFSKRLTGWLNIRWLARGRRFARAAEVLQRLMDDVRERRADFVIFSGDATALGFTEEFAEAARLLGVGQPGGLPGLAVPGNHDYYTPGVAASGDFERCFAPWLEGVRIDEAAYPFARQPGDVCLIGVNSATGNRWPWDATGRVGPEQLDRLRRLLARPEIAGGPRILVTHFPIALADGRPEDWKHRLHDLNQTLEVAKAGGVSLWLHGHRHQPYYLPDTPIPSICAGSGTELGRWTYAEYTLVGRQLRVERRRFEEVTREFERAEEFAVSISG